MKATGLPSLCHNRVIHRLLAVVVLAFGIISLPDSEPGFCAPAQQADSIPDLRQALQKLADFSPDPCGPPYGRESDWHSANAENPLFEQTVDIIIRELNENPGSSAAPRDRVTDALTKVERVSAEVNAAWPEENRFHFEVLDLSPALVVKMNVRAHQRFFVFGVPEEDSGKPNRLWKRVGEDEELAEPEVPQSHFELYPLHRSASGKARFLVGFIHSGCAGSIGVVYDAREWNPLEQVIKLDGSLGLDDKVPGFPQIGKTQTEGALISLPYCWFSPIDTWDNPSLCAVDTYDLSGANIKFHSRDYNRPDLLPIAKVIEYAGKRDYPAVLAYSNSEAAHRMVRDLPSHFFADDLRVTRIGKGRELVQIGDDPIYRFDLENRFGRWLVVAFRTQ